MTFLYTKKLKMPFVQVIERLKDGLSEQGFGIITAIDLKDSFEKNLRVSFRNYKVICACNLREAYKAISLEPHSGVLTTCHIVVQEHENGEVEISAVNPMEQMDTNMSSSLLETTCEEVSLRLYSAIESIQPRKGVPNTLEAAC